MSPRALALLEAKANAVVGLAVSAAVTYLALPLYGLPAPDAGQTAALTGTFFLISVARSYVIRRAFQWWEGRKVQHRDRRGRRESVSAAPPSVSSSSVSSVFVPSSGGPP